MFCSEISYDGHRNSTRETASLTFIAGEEETASMSWRQRLGSIEHFRR
jgi:hypothetical protein